MKMKAVIPVAALLICGCLSKSTLYTEGTKTTVGAYIPYDGQIMGCQIVSCLSGVSFSTTNGNVGITRSHSSTNSYLWGMVQTVESGKTRITTNGKDGE